MHQSGKEGTHRVAQAAHKISDPVLLHIRRELAQQGITLRELGRRSGIHHSLLSRLLRGQLAPTPRLLGRLAPALGVEAGVLYREAGLASPVSLEDALRDMGPLHTLSEAELAKELDALGRQAATLAGAARIRREFPKKRKETAMRGPLLDCLDDMFARYTAGGLPPDLQARVGAALLYFIAPADCIPDDQFPLGYVDDALVIQRVWADLQHRPASEGQGGPEPP